MKKVYRNKILCVGENSKIKKIQFKIGLVLDLNFRLDSDWLKFRILSELI